MQKRCSHCGTDLDAPGHLVLDCIRDTWPAQIRPGRANPLYVVRVVLPPEECNQPAMGLLEVLTMTGLARLHRRDADGACFDLLPPSGVDSAHWADALAESMVQGRWGWYFNAVRAPAWGDGPQYEPPVTG